MSSTHMLILGKCAQTLDGYIDDTHDVRLAISTRGDRQETARLRYVSDVIVVGGETVRRDNPSLLLAGELAERRDREGRPPLAKAVISPTARLDTSGRFFSDGSTRKLVFTAADAPASDLDEVAEVVRLEDEDVVSGVVRWCSEMGLRTLLVEGGGRIHSAFFSAGLYSAFRLATGPFFAGATGAARTFDGRSLLVDPARRFDVLASYSVDGTMVSWLLCDERRRSDVMDLIELSRDLSR